MLVLENKKVLVIGAGTSGVAASLLLRVKGADVTVIDQRDAQDLASARDELALVGATLLSHAECVPEESFDLAITSPGFPATHEWLKECAERSIKTISELELAAGFWEGKILAITGSKGKSSAVKFCAEALTAAGMPAEPCGNYGIPLSRLVISSNPPQWAVTEVSSFQLEFTEVFRPTIAVVLNLQADHLDRHLSFENYAKIKFKIFKNQDAATYALLPDQGFRPSAPPNFETFGTTGIADWHYAEHQVVGTIKNKRVTVNLKNSYFDNHVLGKAAAAITAALLKCGLSEEQIERSFQEFQPLPHRMQIVAKFGGITFIDDSKATSLTALGAALQMLDSPIRLIAGGRLKERDLTQIKDLLTKHVKKVYLIGESAQVLCNAWSDAVRCSNCLTLDKAVNQAIAEADSGETVLLSPGCASFDQFSGYGERGEQFAKLVSFAIKP